MKRGVEWNSQSSEKEISNRERFIRLWMESPLPMKEIVWQTYLYMNRQTLSRLICLHEIYKKIIDVPGVIMQFGVHWGRDLVSLINFRGMYEPSKYTRKIIGFDTFEGLPELHEKDGNIGSKGDFSVTEDYIKYLEELLLYHESECYLSHIKKFELVKGDVRETLPIYLEKNRETIIALAYLDLDLYDPTKKVLEIIEPYLIKGSIIAFDELNFKAFPGESIAFRESFSKKYKLHTFNIDPLISYLVYGE